MSRASTQEEVDKATARWQRGIGPSALHDALGWTAEQLAQYQSDGSIPVAIEVTRKSDLPDPLPESDVKVVPLKQRSEHKAGEAGDIVIGLHREDLPSGSLPMEMSVVQTPRPPAPENLTFKVEDSTFVEIPADETPTAADKPSKPKTTYGPTAPITDKVEDAFRHQYRPENWIELGSRWRWRKPTVDGVKQLYGWEIYSERYPNAVAPKPNSFTNDEYGKALDRAHELNRAETERFMAMPLQPIESTS